MAAFRVKKSQKIYTVKAFSSLVQLAQRGLISAEDPIYVGQLDKWVRAGAIRDLKPYLGIQAPEITPTASAAAPWTRDEAEPESVDEGADDPSDDVLELPIAYVEEVSEAEVQARRDQYKEEMTKWAESRRERQTRRESAPPEAPRPKVGSAPLPGLTSLPMAEIGGSPPSPSPRPRHGSRDDAPQLDLSRPPLFDAPDFPPQSRGRGRDPDPSGRITVQEDPGGLRLGRVLPLLVIPLLLLSGYYLSIRAGAGADFPEAEVAAPPPAPAPQVAPPPRVDPEAEARAAMEARELALRDKVPIKLRQAVTAIQQTQDDIFAELLNGGAYPKKVRIEPLLGEMPPHAALRKVEVNVVVTLGETSRMATDDQLALAALVVGKYVRAGALRVGELGIVVEDSVGGALQEERFSGAQIRDFYSRQLGLADFLGWLDE